ncbi:uncharacterized protein Z520_09815 [Fonsecaea multimorphosa CBS 102226]|uniref:Uncharacterized protein n=1 Tax=Fonsecaea multimorphosa CBS 102226 TaxID=1442371 RepID=A0A0D2JV98_9EURO|nr:uncharacterized protein Z520_09815 [Fonsecaea multimorphosa CBS 102226]KIX94429.1 hypothetical protein Z520_09815 [Fonsecaea multimorphosa CBS 102226]OAL20010.1 hypothetical protein AYO22_09160 [Fonsecaea multimorphosa]
MEPLGLAFSIAPLLGGSMKLVRFYRGLQRVPDDLDRAAARLERLHNNHETLSLFYSNLPEEYRQFVPDPARASVLLSESLPKALTKRSKISCLRWLTGDREVFERLASEAEGEISMAGSLLHIQLLAAQTANGLVHDQLPRLEAFPDPQETETTVTEAKKWVVTKENGSLVTFPLHYCSYAGIWILQKTYRVFNLHGNLSWIVDSIPLLRVVPARHGTTQNLPQLLMYMASAVHRLAWRGWLEALLSKGRLLYSHEVSPEHEFLRASKEGDVVRMQQLLVLRKASPFDTTAEGITALCLAIQYGRHDAVKLLLAQAALVDRAFGVKQTSPLCWALKHRQLEICRTLLSYGASLDYSTLHNWSPLYYLWPWDMAEGFRHPPAAEFITMLRARGEEFHLLHHKHVDNHGWSLMHRAAIFADPADLQLLMDYGVDAFEPDSDFGWTPLHFVAKYGIHENFATLFRAYEKKLGSSAARELQDSRGWTPLHLATSNGHFELVRTLLDLGADRKARTEEINDRKMPESIQGKRCSPQELAWAFGESRGHCFEDLAAAIPEDQWTDAAEYPEENLCAKPFKLPGQLSKAVVKNMASFVRRFRQS